MSKSTTPAQAGTEKTRKPRAPKQMTPADLIIQIEKLPLRDKLSILGMISKSIDNDRECLEDQLKLIQGNTPAAQPVKPDFPEDHIS